MMGGPSVGADAPGALVEVLAALLPDAHRVLALTLANSVGMTVLGAALLFAWMRERTGTIIGATLSMQ